MEADSNALLTFKNGINYSFIFSYSLCFHTGLNFFVYDFEILEIGRELETRFTCLFKIMDNGKDLKSIDLFPPEYYKGKGISIAVILKAKDLFNKRIISSSNDKETHSGEMRWEDATEKVWKRMVANGLAKYDHENDYYYTL